MGRHNDKHSDIALQITFCSKEKRKYYSRTETLLNYVNREN